MRVSLFIAVIMLVSFSTIAKAQQAMIEKAIENAAAMELADERCPGMTITSKGHAALQSIKPAFGREIAAKRREIVALATDDKMLCLMFIVMFKSTDQNYVRIE